MLDKVMHEDTFSPFIHNGDWYMTDDIDTVISQEIYNGLVENEQIISEAEAEVRPSVIEEIFRNYPFIENFTVIEYNGIEDYNFEYSIKVEV